MQKCGWSDGSLHRTISSVKLTNGNNPQLPRAKETIQGSVVVKKYIHMNIRKLKSAALATDREA